MKFGAIGLGKEEKNTISMFRLVADKCHNVNADADTNLKEVNWNVYK